MTRSRFGPPPETSFDLTPTRDEVEFFRDNGFLVVERLTTDEEIAWIRQIFEFIFSPEQADAPSAPVDRSGDSPGHANSIGQAFFPEIRFPELLETTHRRNALRYAAALLDVEPEKLSSWGHMIRKTAGGCAVSWHQDHAYWEPELDYHALGVWLPMHDVPVEMGCMQFIRGSHKQGLLPHRHEEDPAANLLTVIDEVDLDRAVACPLRAGGATFHHYETLHHTAANTTDRDRLAFPMEFQCAPVRRAVPEKMPWVDERRAVVGTPPLVYVADGKFVSV